MKKKLKTLDQLEAEGWMWNIHNNKLINKAFTSQMTKDMTKDLGTEIEVIPCDEILGYTWKGPYHYWRDDWFIQPPKKAWGNPISAPTSKDPCTCILTDLMRYGCKCGCFAREKEVS